jgi:hypothetical protein
MTNYILVPNNSKEHQVQYENEVVIEKLYFYI